MLERHLALILITSHDHTCDPEEDNIRARYQVTRRIVVVDLLIARIIDAVEERDRPKPRGEPGIQYILILTQISHRQGGIAALLLRHLQCLLRCLGYYIATLRQEIGRYAMTPPQLTADTPILDVLHPVTISILEFRRIELDLIIHHRR